MEAVVDVKYRPALFLNGGGAGAAVSSASAVAKKMRPAAAWGAGEAGTYVYRECLKNHAASLGGHALDGCGEFMPSPEADPANPASLRCAACGCHRNFHRRLPEAPPSPPLLALPPPPPPPQLQPAQAPALAPAVAAQGMRDAPAMRGEETPEDRVPAVYDDETEDEGSDESSDFEEDRPVSPLPPVMGPPTDYLQSPAMAPHMLLALNTTGAASPPPSLGPVPAAAAAVMARKRSRTKFSTEQKQRMQALSERIGWRLQKRDEAVVEESCREIGVTKGVFKVWMHNNKHNFVGGHSARRSASAAAGAGFLPSTHAAAVHPYTHTAPTGAAILPSHHAASVHPFPSHHAAAVHHSPHTHAAPAAQVAAPAPAPPQAPVHADFHINGTAAAAADYFRVQPATATTSGGSPQSS